MSLSEPGTVVGIASKQFLVKLVEKVPTPLRFLCVGSMGLASDMGVFALLDTAGMHPLIARIFSLIVATFVTWRLNRMMTFEKTGRRQHAEAMRYAAVTAVAQGISYLTFVALIMTVADDMRLLAIIAGAAVATVFSYNGHRLFSFAQGQGKPDPVS